MEDYLMSAKTIIQQARLNEWASRFADQKASGLTVAEWCEINAISKDLYYYWKRRVKDSLLSQALPDIVPLSLSTSHPVVMDSTAVSTPIEESHSTCTTCTTVSCARVQFNGVTIELDASAPESLICSLIKAVKYA